MKTKFLYPKFLYSFLLVFVFCVGKTNFSVGAIPPYIPTSGLKAWYPFTGSANDSSGYAANGVAYGGVSYGTDRFGNASSCYVGNGSSGVNIPVTNLPIGDHSRSISAWYKLILPYPSTIREIIAWGNNSALSQRYGIITTDTLIGLEYLNGSVTTHLSPDSTWHNIIITYSSGGSSGVNLYIDGVPQTTSTYVPVSSFATDTGYVHTLGTLFLASSYLYSWKGSLDDIGVWDRVLTTCEIWQISHSSLDSSSTSTITGPSSLCVGSSITLADTLGGGTWKSSFATIATIDSNTGVVTGVSVGIDTIKYKVITACAVVTATKIVTVDSAIAPGTIAGDSILCQGATTNLLVVGGASGGTWNSGSAGIATVNSSGTVTGVSPGLVTISYTVISACGTVIVTHAITVYPLPDAGSITGGTNFCAGTTIVLSDAASGGVWSSSNISIATVSGVGIVTGILSGNVTITYSVTNACGNAYAVAPISIDASPVIVIEPRNPELCIGNNIVLTASGALNYNWNPSTGLSTTTGTSVTANPGLTTTYTVIGTSMSGCVDSSTTTVTVYPSFVLNNVTDSQTISFGSSVQLNADGANIYLWKPNDGSLSNPNINNPVATPQVSTLYEVYGYTDFGCFDSASVYIDVKYSSADFIPTAFTPNGDGKNDVFKISRLPFGKLVSFKVFNRWGTQIFETENISNGWDGSFEGVPQDIGVYNYLIIVAPSDGQNKYYKGGVTLIR